MSHRTTSCYELLWNCLRDEINDSLKVDWKGPTWILEDFERAQKKAIENVSFLGKFLTLFFNAFHFFVGLPINTDPLVLFSPNTNHHSSCAGNSSCSCPSEGKRCRCLADNSSLTGIANDARGGSGGGGENHPCKGAASIPASYRRLRGILHPWTENGKSCQWAGEAPSGNVS